MTPTDFRLGTSPLSASRTTWPLNSGVKFLRFRFAIGASFQVVDIIPQSWFREWPEFRGAVQDLQGEQQ